MSDRAQAHDDYQAGERIGAHEAARLYRLIPEDQPELREAAEAVVYLFQQARHSLFKAKLESLEHRTAKAQAETERDEFRLVLDDALAERNMVPAPIVTRALDGVTAELRRIGIRRPAGFIGKLVNELRPLDEWLPGDNILPEESAAPMALGTGSGQAGVNTEIGWEQTLGYGVNLPIVVHDPGCPAVTDDDSDYEHLDDAGECTCGAR